MNAVCEYPGCRDTASRQFPEMVERDGRRCCIFRLFCASHVPADVLHLTAAAQIDPSAPGQIHVPRVWEVTGQHAIDARAADREWQKSRELLTARRALGARRRTRAAILHSGTRSV